MSVQGAHQTEHKRFGDPDETREVPRGRAEILSVGDAQAGDVTSLPSGHDAWVIGEQPVVVVDWYGASNYARASS